MLKKTNCTLLPLAHSIRSVLEGSHCLTSAHSVPSSQPWKWSILWPGQCDLPRQLSVHSEDGQASVKRPRSRKSKLSVGKTDDKSICSAWGYDYEGEHGCKIDSVLLQPAILSQQVRWYCWWLWRRCLYMFTMWRFLNHHPVTLGLFDMSYNYAASYRILLLY
jgi:hypothetical protein